MAATSAQMAATFCLIVVCVYADVTEQNRTSSPYALRADGADAQSLRTGFTVKFLLLLRPHRAKTFSSVRG